MSKYERDDRVVDSGLMRVADLLPNANDEIEAILTQIEIKSTKDGSKSYKVYWLFSETRGEIILNSFGSNLERVMDKAIAENRFNGRSMPFLAIGIETITGPSINPRTGEEQWWHNVYIEKIKEPNKFQADIDKLRARAKAETKAIIEGRPYAPAVAAAPRQQNFDDAMNSAMDQEIPF